MIHMYYRCGTPGHVLGKVRLHCNYNVGIILYCITFIFIYINQYSWYEVKRSWFEVKRSIVKSLTRKQSDTRQSQIIIDEGRKYLTDSVGKATVLNAFVTSQTVINNENSPVPNAANISLSERKYMELDNSEV